MKHHWSAAKGMFWVVAMLFGPLTLAVIAVTLVTTVAWLWQGNAGVYLSLGSGVLFLVVAWLIIQVLKIDE